MKLRKENKNNNFIQQFVSSASPYGTILESIRWTQTVYAVLCQLHYTDTLFSFKSKRKQMYKTYLCGAADIEQRTQFAFSGYSPKQNMLKYVVYMLACEFSLFQVQSDPPMNNEV